jgi:DNA helicase-2/ATP-dependent DNA helicase PcrA
MREYEKEAEEPTLAGLPGEDRAGLDVDGYDPEKGAVSLMTVHTAKGLEFPLVFLAGLEEGVFPHQRSIDDDAAIEEERRLCYVAVTRAMKRLFLCRRRRRRLAGQELGACPAASSRTSRPSAPRASSCRARLLRGRHRRRRTLGRQLEPRRSTTAARLARLRAPARREAVTPGEITVHYDDGGDDHGLRIGAKLSHPNFGVGEVRAWQGAGKDLKVTIRFPKAG